MHPRQPRGGRVAAAAAAAAAAAVAVGTANDNITGLRFFREKKRDSVGRSFDTHCEHALATKQNPPGVQCIAPMYVRPDAFRGDRRNRARRSLTCAVRCAGGAGGGHSGRRQEHRVCRQHQHQHQHQVKHQQIHQPAHQNESTSINTNTNTNANINTTVTPHHRHYPTPNTATPPYTPYILHIGWVGVGWQRHYETCRSHRELDNQGTIFLLFGGRSQLAMEINHLCGVENPYSAQGMNDRITLCLW